MNSKLVRKDGKEFHDPAEGVITGTDFGIIWKNSNTTYSVVISRFGWRISEEARRGYLLTDSSGEVRVISWGKYHPAIEFGSWEAYDHDRNARELARLREELTQANTTLEKYSRALAQIHDTNKKAGPHSRSGVTSIIKAVINLTTCSECGMVRCICGDDSFG